MKGSADLAGLRVAVFGFDATEASQIRRIRALRALGCDVTAFCQRRGNMDADFQPDWPLFDLGRAPNRGFVRRGAGLPAAVTRALAGWRELAQADLVIARNLDLALIALAARRIAAMRAGRPPAPLVYECLDIHGLMTREGRIGAAMRALERRVLARTALLVLSSPGFLRHYFKPLQGWDGPTALVENKLYLGDDPPKRPAAPGERGGPLVLGLVGSIRCKPSVDLLLETALRMGGDLRLHFAGNVHEHAVPGFHRAIAAHPFAEWAGPYSYPSGLPAAYAPCDLVWAQDMWQAGANSEWLLPNRIYEASWCGCPQIALGRTETGRRIAQDGLGWVLDAPTPGALETLLRGLSRSQIAARADALLARPAADFVQSPDDLRVMLAPALGASAPPS
ncbi:MAG: glycosyltransferase [Paracoccus sp. (in: a-proteobacteria)]|nr:glycosyltransferase [Paracoccus sp. (in: a-proteobacteria)]